MRIKVVSENYMIKILNLKSRILGIRKGGNKREKIKKGKKEGEKFENHAQLLMDPLVSFPWWDLGEKVFLKKKSCT